MRNVYHPATQQMQTRAMFSGNGLNVFAHLSTSRFMNMGSFWSQRERERERERRKKKEKRREIISVFQLFHRLRHQWQKSWRGSHVLLKFLTHSFGQYPFYCYLIPAVTYTNTTLFHSSGPQSAIFGSIGFLLFRFSE